MNEKEKVIARLKENPLDRERWIEAGKAMGWGEAMFRIEYYVDGDEKFLIWVGENGHHYTPHIMGWLYQWHRFITHLSSGGSIDSFFNQL